MISADAQSIDPNSQALMTARDVQAGLTSNITITNRTGQTITSSGLFIASYDVNDCSACTGNILAGDNVAGAMVSMVSLSPNQTVSIGQNYLYNMLYNGIYYVRSNGASPCLLPGCSWPADTPNITWCITINAISPNSSYTSSNYTRGSLPPAKAPRYSAAGNFSPYYKYDLIDPLTLGSGNACLGPITCDDQTLTCSVSTAQNEVLQPY